MALSCNETDEYVFPPPNRFGSDDSLPWEIHPAIDSLSPFSISDKFIPLVVGYQWIYAAWVGTDAGGQDSFYTTRTIVRLNVSGTDSSFVYTECSGDGPCLGYYPEFSERADLLSYDRTYSGYYTMTILKFPLVKGNRWRAVSSDTLNIHEWAYFEIRATDSALTVGSRNYEHAIFVESSNQQYFPHKRFVIVPGIGIVYEKTEDGLAGEIIKLKRWKF